MQKYNNIYKIISKINFWLHVTLFIFILAVSFLPFREQQNFYGVFSGYAYLFLALLFLAGLSSLGTIKRPFLSIITLILTYAFFISITFGYALESVIINFVSNFYGSTVTPAPYNTGLILMSNALNFISYVDFIFAIYSIVTIIVRRIHKNNQINKI